MKVELKIWRYDASTGERALKPYEVDVSGEATLLDTLDAVKDKVDGSLAYRKSCRMMICGSCGMRVNGGAVLACKVRISDLVADGKVPVVSAMGNLPIVKDLVVDMAPFWQKMQAIQPYLEPRLDGAIETENVVSQKQMETIHKESLCINCGCCVSECNSMESDPDFLGPAALAKGFRFVGDARDGATIERLERYSEEHGIWDCTRCYFCNERCPKGVDPRDAIAKLGAEAMKVGHRPRHGREAREVVRHLREDDRLAPRDRARPEDAGRRQGDQGDQVRDVAPPEGQGAAAFPAARRGRRGRVARALRSREDAGARRRGRHRPGGEGAPPSLGDERVDRRRPDRPLRRPALVRQAVPSRRRAGFGRLGFPSVKQVAYYKGCLASLSAKELDTSTKALAPKLGYELLELDSVTCCGAGDIHEAEPDYYLHLNARILAYAAATGTDTLMTVCNVCTLNLRQANHQLLHDSDLRARVNDNLERVGAPRYDTDVDCVHFLWLVAGESFPQLQEVAHKGLRGLKIAPFYGCQILRPSKLMGFEDPDNPDSLERIIAACGGEAIDYPAKIKCCGFPIIQAREDTALGELIQPIEQAKEAGADAIVTPCPLCHLSLDAWQSKLKKQTGKDFQMPILHLSQLIGVAAGLADSELRFRRHVVSVEPVLEKLAL